jgi:hypothetical protein
MKPEITLIKKRGPNPIMSKRVFLDELGKVCSDGSQCLMAQGIATRATAETAAALAKHIVACGTDQAIALGTLRVDLPHPVAITIPERLKDSPGAITRCRDFIDYCSGTPAWALIDFDTKGMPANVATSIEAAGGMWNALLTVAPGLQRAARVSRASTSSGLFRTDTGTQFDGSGGAHHYVLVEDGSDIERFLRDLHDRCWQRGLGWHLIGRAGQLLDRSLVDRTVAYGERLCFEGVPVIEPPLAQDVTKRTPNVFEGEAVDTELVVPPAADNGSSSVPICTVSPPCCGCLPAPRVSPPDRDGAGESLTLRNLWTASPGAIRARRRSNRGFARLVASTLTNGICRQNRNG